MGRFEASTIAALLTALLKSKGYCEPEDLTHEYVLEIATPYLGEIMSCQTDWSPLKSLSKLYRPPLIREDEPWQFANFIRQ